MKLLLLIFVAIQWLFFLAPFDIHANDATDIKSTAKLLQPQTNFKSPISYDYFVGLPFNHAGDFVLGFGRLGLGYKPFEDNQFITHVGLEHFFGNEGESNNLDFQTKFMNLRWSGGYTFNINDDVSIIPSLGVALDLTELSPITTQGYVNLRTEYDITDSFTLFVEVIYDFESNILPHNQTIGFGIKYTPNYQQPLTDLICCKNKTVSMQNTKVAKNEFINETPIQATIPSYINKYLNMRFTIQLGAFSSLSAAKSYREQSLMDPNKTYIRELNGLAKIYYEGYNDLDLANEILKILQVKYSDGFVLNTPKIEKNN